MSQTTMTIDLLDGDPSGLLRVIKSDWRGSALSFARHDYVERVEIRKRGKLNTQAGVYVLVGENDEGQPHVYIGQSNTGIRGRLDIHAKSEEKGGKDFWTRALVFAGVGSDIGATEVVFVEKALIRIASAAAASGRGTVENATGIHKPKPVNEGPQLVGTEHSITGENFLDGVLDILPFMGITLFESLESGGSERLLGCSGPAADAKGYESSAGFVVKAGSKARKDGVASWPSTAKTLRDSLVGDGVLKDDGESLVFVSDYQFKSPSAAASVVLARSANGRTEWKDDSNRTLVQLDEEALNSA